MDYQNRLVLLDLPLQVTCQEKHNPLPDNIDLATKGAIIPFCRGERGTFYLATNSSGVSTTAVMMGGGSMGLASITLTNPTSTTPSFIQNNTHYYYSFIMPYNGTLRSIYFTAVNFNPWTLGTEQAFPYVALYTAQSNSRVFTLIPETKVPVSTPFRGILGRNEASSGFKKDLDVPIAAGTRIAIMGGMDATYGTPTHYFEFAGSLFFSENPI